MVVPRTPACGLGTGRYFNGNVLHGSSGFGHRWHVKRICSPWFSMYLSGIGHRRAFVENCSPCAWIKKENISVQRADCVQKRIGYGEQFLIMPWLCPKNKEMSKNEGNKLSKTPFCTQNLKDRLFLRSPDWVI